MNRDAPPEEQIVDRALEDVGQRQERKRAVGGAEREQRLAAEHVGHEVRVREHHALRIAGGPGGVDDARYVGGCDPSAEVLERLLADAFGAGGLEQHQRVVLAARVVVERDPSKLRRLRESATCRSTAPFSASL